MEKKNYYKYKGYAHFDKRISIGEARKYVEKPQYVAKHGFYPFLHFTLKINRYRRKEQTPKERRKPKLREIYYAAHIDRYIYQYYAHKLNEKYNVYCKGNGLDSIAVAYRTNKKGKCNIHFAYEVFSFLRKHSGSIVIAGDFEKFFDNLDHKYLKQCLLKVLNVERLPEDWFAVYKNICNFSYVDIQKILDYNKSVGDLSLPITLRQLNHCDTVVDIIDLRKQHRDWIIPKKEDRKEYGIPQGSPISGVLANVYMIEFDEKIKEICQNAGGFYRRYSDDFIIILPNKSLSGAKKEIDNIFAVKEQIANRGRLDLQPEKTKCFYFKDGNITEVSMDGDLLDDKQKQVNFLGFSFNGKDVDLRGKTKHRNDNKIMRRIRRLKKLRGFVRRDGSIVQISFRSLVKNSGKNYNLIKISGGKERKKSTFNSYLKRSMKVFKGEQIIKSQYVNRKKHVVRLMNRILQRKQIKNNGET